MRMQPFALATATLALTLSGPAANALEEAGQAYITPMGTYIDPDSDRTLTGDSYGDKVDSGIQGGQLAVGYALNERWNIEAALQRFSFDGENTSGSDIDQTGLMLNALNVYNRDGTFAPYWLAGLGWVNTDGGATQGDQDNLQAQAGVGLFTDLFGERVALRTEALYRWEDASDSFSDWLINVGLQIAIGTKAAAPVAVAAAPVAAAVAAPPPPPPPPPADSDGDGVVDASDQCPDTPEG